MVHHSLFSIVLLLLFLLTMVKVTVGTNTFTNPNMLNIEYEKPLRTIISLVLKKHKIHAVDYITGIIMPYVSVLHVPTLRTLPHSRVDFVIPSFDQRLLYTSAVNHLYVSDARTGQCLRSIHTGLPMCTGTVATDDTLLATGHMARIIIWDMLARTLRTTLTNRCSDDHINALTIFNENTQLLSGSSHNTLRIWDLRSKLVLHELPVYGIHSWKYGWKTSCVSPDNQWVVTYSPDQHLRIWNIQNGLCIHALTANKNVRALAISKDSMYIGVFIDNSFYVHRIEIWNLKASVWRLEKVLDGYGTLLTGTLTKKFIVSTAIRHHSFDQYYISIWSLRTYKKLSVLTERIPKHACVPIHVPLMDGFLTLWEPGPKYYYEHVKVDSTHGFIEDKKRSRICEKCMIL